MQRFLIVHEFDGTPADFWGLFFRDDYNRAFYGSVDVELEVLEDTRTGGRIDRTVRYRSTKEPIALVKPFLPGGLGYVERSQFDSATGRFEHAIEPNAMGDRAEIRGAITVEPIAPGRIRRTYEGTVSIKVPLLGARFEAGAIEQMKKTNDTAAAVTAEWLAKQAAE
jgi:hypothetical protein